MNSEINQQLSTVLNQAFYNLGMNLDLDDQESIVNIVQSTMTMQSRYYHNLEHVLNLCSPDNPIQSLAALFHDLVYYQVDHGLSQEVLKLLHPYLTPCKKCGDYFKLTAGAPGNDIGFNLTVDIFGFSLESDLCMMKGSNEFLSALVMAKSLIAIISIKKLLQIIAYIEATIPFRGRDEGRMSPFEQLSDRLRIVSSKYSIPFSEADIQTTIKGAVGFANRDIEYFAHQDPAKFLDWTMKPMPEFTPAIRQGVAYSIVDYRRALQDMLDFLQSIRPTTVFHDFAGTPDPDDLHAKLSKVRRNLRVSREYIEIKLLTVGIIEALAKVSGGDAPVAFFLGDDNLPLQDMHNLAASSLVPDITLSGTGRAIPIEKLLYSNRNGLVDTTDSKTLPLALSIYRTLGKNSIHANLEFAQKMFIDRLQPDEFLQRFDVSLLEVVVNAVITHALPRSTKLMAFIQKLKDNY